MIKENNNIRKLDLKIFNLLFHLYQLRRVNKNKKLKNKKNN